MSTKALRAVITFNVPPEDLTDESIARLNQILLAFDEFDELAPDCCAGFVRTVPGKYTVSSVELPAQLLLTPANKNG